jgi:hypothetical protein
MELPEAVLYNGTDDLYILIVCDDGETGNFANNSHRPIVATYPVNNVGGSMILRDQINNSTLPMIRRLDKPILRLFCSSPPPTITLVQPGNSPQSIEFNKGEIIEPGNSKYPFAAPRFSVNFENVRAIDADVPYKIIYEIRGPLPSNSMVYQMVDSRNMGNTFLSVRKSDPNVIGNNFTSDVNSAIGVMASTVNSHHLDFSDMIAGSYKVSLKVVPDVAGLPSNYDTVVRENIINIRVFNDLEVTTLTSPILLSDYPINSDAGIKVSAIVKNVGTNPVPLEEFFAQAYIYRINYDPVSGLHSRISNVPFDTLPRNRVFPFEVQKLH